jgi:hypothetical protein
LVSQDSAVDMPLAMPALLHPLRVPESERERYAKRAAAWLIVLFLHILFITGLVVASRLAVVHRIAPKETILILQPPPGQKKALPFPPPPLPTIRPPEIAPPTTITLPPPQPQQKSQPKSGTIEDFGRELACGAGSYENLTQAEREACKRQPWHFKKDSHGVIVMDHAPQPEDTQLSGAEEERHEIEQSNPCVAAGATHSECIHKSIFGH